LLPAIEHAKAKIEAKAKAEAAALASNLGIILDDWCTERRVALIPWASNLDPVKPQFAIDFLAERLAQRLGEIRFAQFLENFAEQIIELHDHEKRSQ